MGVITQPKIKCGDCAKYLPILIADKEIGIVGFGKCPKRPIRKHGTVQEDLNGNILYQRIDPEAERYCIGFAQKAGGR